MPITSLLLKVNSKPHSHCNEVAFTEDEQNTFTFKFLICKLKNNL